MPKNKVNSPVFVYNDSHLSLKHQKWYSQTASTTHWMSLCSLKHVCRYLMYSVVYRQSCSRTVKETKSATMNIFRFFFYFLFKSFVKVE